MVWVICTGYASGCAVLLVELIFWRLGLGNGFRADLLLGGTVLFVIWMWNFSGPFFVLIDFSVFYCAYLGCVGEGQKWVVYVLAHVTL